ncbi:hypothetical protein MTO96_020663 [Rhipicephalus appendiculatus]
MKIVPCLRIPLHVRTPQRGKICLALQVAAIILLFCGVFYVYAWRVYELINCCEESKRGHVIVETADYTGSTSYPLNVIRTPEPPTAVILLDALVRCRFDPLYTVWLENNPYYKYNHFLADICEGGQSCSSPSHLSALCSRAGTQVFKFTRLRASQVESWIEQNRDIAQAVRVVHLVRDPRAIYSSRRGLRWCTDYEYCGSAACLVRSDEIRPRLVQRDDQPNAERQNVPNTLRRPHR